MKDHRNQRDTQNAPTVRNIPRSPVIVATLSGINSIQALLEAASSYPCRYPDQHEKARNTTFPAIQRPTPRQQAQAKQDGADRSEDQPQIRGFRYPHRVTQSL